MLMIEYLSKRKLEFRNLFPEDKTIKNYIFCINDYVSDKVLLTYIIRRKNAKLD